MIYKGIIFLLIALFVLTSVAATELGVNYYHESLFTQAWNQPHIPRGDSGARADLDHIKQISNNVKFFLHPFVPDNADWVEFLVQEGENRGMHTVVTIMVDDRQLDNGNWGTYANNVRNLCTRFNGKADEFLVGNEIVLHSPFDKYEVKNRISQLISECEARFSGPVSYQEFWYAKEAWYGSGQRLYWMQYEGLSNFETNVQEMVDRFGSNGLIGEWGEDSIDEGVERDDWWQRVETEKRWNILNQKGVPVAYVFTYKEPSWNAFGLVDPNGGEKPVWDYFVSVLGGSYVPPPAPEPEPQQPTQQPQQTSGVGSYPVSCTKDGSSCSVTADSNDGTCRTVSFTQGVQIKGCMKGSEIEVYRLAASGNYEACIGGVCVNSASGYGRGVPDATQTQEPVQNPTQEPTPSVPSLSGIGSYPLSCQSNCGLVSDVVTGTCRTIQYNTAAGFVQVFTCQKGNEIEVYRQQAPSGNFEVCVGGVCVSDENGFGRGVPSGASQPPQQQPTQQPQGTSLASLNVVSNPAGSKTIDTTAGCRTVAFSTGAGNIQAQICDKGGHYEMYRQSSKNNAQICVGASCVGSNGGFAIIGK